MVNRSVIIDMPLPATAGAAMASRNTASVIVISEDHEMSTENICAMHVVPDMNIIIAAGLSIKCVSGMPTFTRLGVMPSFFSQSSMEVESAALLEAVDKPIRKVGSNF